MRGLDARTGELFSYVDLEARVRAGHPLRPIRAIVNEALSALEQELAPLYARIGRPSIPPLGTPVDGAPRIRPALPLVRRARGR